MKIITDSSSDITPVLCERFGVDHVIPLRISVDGKDYLDKVDLTYDDFYYHILPGCKQLPKTSQPPIGEFLELFERWPDEDILLLPLSSGLSGAYNTACLAASQTGRSNIYVVDTQATTLALTLMTEIACRLRDEGRSAAEIKAELESIAPRVRIYAPVETLHYLVMGGRLSKVAGAVGSALRIMPIICMKDGVLAAVGKAHGFKSALRTMRTYVDRDPIDLAYPVYFAHVNNEDGVRQMRAMFPEAPDAATSLWVGSVVGTHVGPGTTAISYIAK